MVPTADAVVLPTAVFRLPRRLSNLRVSLLCLPLRRAGKKAKVKGKKPAAPKKDTSAAGIAGLKPTVGTQFREQLHNLMDMIR